MRGDRALTEADAVDARPDRGNLPRAGVPVAIKDNVGVTGEPCRVGSAGTDPAAATEDHEVVRRLRGAGGVVVGITRVPELCVYGTTDSTWLPFDRAQASTAYAWCETRAEPETGSSTSPVAETLEQPRTRPAEDHGRDVIEDPLALAVASLPVWVLEVLLRTGPRSRRWRW